MPVYKDDKTGTWYVKFYYTDYTGIKRQKKKRGFKLQREAKKWEDNFLVTQAAQPSMPFETLCSLYLEDARQNRKEITYNTKKGRIDNWILPFFQKKPVDSITPADIRKWQTDLKNSTNKKGRPFTSNSLQNIVVEMSGIFNYAVRFYGLTSNPCSVAGNTIGKADKRVMFWTKEEFDNFAETFDKDDPYYTAFLLLYYSGIRVGEMQALTAADIDFTTNELKISKTFHRIRHRDVITPPKTPRSNRTVILPAFLAARLSEYMRRIYDLKPSSRLFVASYSSYSLHLKAHTATAGLTRIHIHDLRHSHASLLINTGCSALLVSERLGHENVSTTLDVYSHLFPSKQTEVVSKIEQLCTENTY